MECLLKLYIQDNTSMTVFFLLKFCSISIESKMTSPSTMIFIQAPGRSISSATQSSTSTSSTSSTAVNSSGTPTGSRKPSKRVKSSKKTGSKSQPDTPPSSNLGVARPTEVVASMTDLRTADTTPRLTVENGDENQQLRRAVSNLDLNDNMTNAS